MVDTESNIHYVDTNSLAWVDMALMSQCSHHIAANSSFSWWAAWLGSATDKIVIGPKKWFAVEEALPSPTPFKWITI